MSCKRIIWTAAVVSLSLASCETLFPVRTSPTSTEVFDELWNAVDEKYACFSNRDVDWDVVYTEYRGRISEETSENELFTVLSGMLGELNDGHVGLSTETQSWGGDYLEDISDNHLYRLVSRYLGKDKKESGGLQYSTLYDGRVGYIVCESFEDSISDKQIEEVLDYCKDCQGLILDLRKNRGGESKNVMTLLKYLSLEKELYKTYVRHSRIREELMEEGVMLKPCIQDESKIWRKPLVVLVDNKSYSAASIFAMCVKGCENARVVGVKTAGGTSFPDWFELSNGWYFRIPTVKIISRSGVDYEKGVVPDVEIHLDVDLASKKSMDSIIDAACEMIVSW